MATKRMDSARVSRTHKWNNGTYEHQLEGVLCEHNGGLGRPFRYAADDQEEHCGWE